MRKFRRGCARSRPFWGVALATGIAVLQSLACSGHVAGGELAAAVGGAPAQGGHGSAGSRIGQSCGDGLVVASRDFCRSDGAFCTVLEDGTYCTGAAPRQCPPGQQVIGLGLCGPVGGAGGSDGSGAAGNASADGGSIGGEGGVAPGGAD